MRCSFAGISYALLACSTALAAPGWSHQWKRSKELNDYAKKAGLLYFGTAADIPSSDENTDVAYQRILNNTHEFGQVTPANAMKWDATEPQQGDFTFGAAEQFLGFPTSNHQLVRCHNLVWHSQLPSWITSGTWTNATLQAVLKSHITTLVQHFGTRCYAWDVLNEALNDNGTLRQDVWLNTIGPAYIPLVFQFAEEALKGVKGGRKIKFYYNDYNIENPGPKSAAALGLVKGVKDRGIKIDGVGLQSHFTVGGTPSRETQVQNLQSFTTAGFDVALTELDVRFSNVSDLSVGGGLEQQSQDYEN
ncbi:hypothetical protein LTS18_003549 [Coniosporium uncinatum]|uniref:Uncharacterized protein n=1 Tax=Coniosporium uncinatum TaxID=93489 RepID=A0ACC3DTE8_9PEZI|nr:hypothetical protein LTS18_003549 [Coniosporium uncinatum]